MSKQLEQFLKSYWEYYLDLENQLLETQRFVAFDEKNKKSFSIEYLKLYQAVCSEIDVVGKEIAVVANSNFKPDKCKSIQKWGYEVQQKFPQLKEGLVTFNGTETLQPFKNWEYEYYTVTDKDGKTSRRLRIKGQKSTIKWWSSYNKVKHRRIGLVEGTNNFHLANQQNLIEAFSALFLLEITYIKNLDQEAHYQESKLFKIVDKEQ